MLSKALLSRSAPQQSEQLLQQQAEELFRHIGGSITRRHDGIATRRRRRRSDSNSSNSCFASRLDLRNGAKWISHGSTTPWLRGLLTPRNFASSSSCSPSCNMAREGRMDLAYSSRTLSFISRATETNGLHPPPPVSPMPPVAAATQKTQAARRSTSSSPQQDSSSFPSPSSSLSSISSLVSKNAETRTALRPLYFDYQATTPLDPRVLDRMMRFQVDCFGNPHSNSHAAGWEARHAVERAREQVASVLGLPSSRSREVIFTSGATESNNLAIKGSTSFLYQLAHRSGKSRKLHVVTSQIEHKCVLQCCRMLNHEFAETRGARGVEVTFLPVKPDGLLDLDSLEKAIRPETVLVSIMHVNNEIGVVQDLEAIGKICRKKNVIFHTDAAQGFGKISIDVDAMGIDLLSVSGHKIYGPKGVGALFVRSRSPKVRLVPLIDGGGQERGMRSGTLPTPLVVGLGEAAELSLACMDSDRKHIQRLSSMLLRGLRERLPHVVLNGSEESRYFGNLNISFKFVEGESVLMSLGDIAMSSGSACTSDSLEPSYVLRSLGVGEETAHTSLRIGVGRFTREEEIHQCIDRLVTEVSRLRSLSPLYEMELGASKDGSESSSKMVWT